MATIGNSGNRALGLALEALSEHWQEQNGYRPLMAETRKVPSWRALHNFLTEIAPEAFSQCLEPLAGQ